MLLGIMETNVTRHLDEMHYKEKNRKWQKDNLTPTAIVWW